jgi:hypothetical protein
MSLPDSVSNLIDIRTKKGSVAVGHVKQIARIAYMLGLATKNKEAHRPVRRKPPVQQHKVSMPYCLLCRSCVHECKLYSQTTCATFTAAR